MIKLDVGYDKRVVMLSIRRLCLVLGSTIRRLERDNDILHAVNYGYGVYIYAEGRLLSKLMTSCYTFVPRQMSN